MEKRIGVLAILVSEKESISMVNSLLSNYADLIFARQGLPFRERHLFIISLIVEGLPDQINQLSGKLGKLQGVEAKVMFAKTSIS